ncbi:TIGR04086 family membrane protein [Thermaerobacter sp. PB12/4term]|uniref:TIGR04086 family membrane protein n=1 Tax=Thermaerobacter sp. PB12/4term TaxID=2293838 RepID=UPI000E328A1A|nr:TIGR04086 family membrane protein [Thermaerobacter sp. PB12/4term]QIA27031.1 TIGR04086 family membrane protein [Thermaerobacter sp. PB12/4term]
MQGADARERFRTPSPFHARAVLVGAAVSLVLVVLASGVLALAVYFTALNEYQLNAFLYYLGMLATAAGGLVAARAADHKGWLHGGAAGLLYVLVGSALGHWLFPAEATPLAQLGPRMLLGFILGAIGGAVGMLL